MGNREEYVIFSVGNQMSKEIVYFVGLLNTMKD